VMRLGLQVRRLVVPRAELRRRAGRARAGA
jgi:hypothetical protein